jgi:hypothetical protein
MAGPRCTLPVRIATSIVLTSGLPAPVIASIAGVSQPSALDIGNNEHVLLDASLQGRKEPDAMKACRPVGDLDSTVSSFEGQFG